MSRGTFLDAGALIAGARGSDPDWELLLPLLEDPEHWFVVSPLLY